MTTSVNAQSVGIGTTEPNKSVAILHIKVPNPNTHPQGMILPQLSTTQLNNIAISNTDNDVNGLLVYDSTENKIKYYDISRSKWVSVDTSSKISPWEYISPTIIHYTDSIGIGTTSPASRLHVQGNITTDSLTADSLYIGNLGSTGQVLTSFGLNKSAQWTTLPSPIFDTLNQTLYTPSSEIQELDFVIGSSQLNNITSTTTDDARLFFDKSKYAFRAGIAESKEWDEDSVGIATAAFGKNNTVNGNYSSAFGVSNSVRETHSFVTGYSNTVTGTFNHINGNSNKSSQRHITAHGYNNNISGEFSISFGHSNRVTGEYSTSIGKSNTISSLHAYTHGLENSASANYAYANGNQNSASANFAYAHGKANSVSGSFASTYGNGNSSSGNHSFVVGNQNSNEGHHAFIFGIENDITDSLSIILGKNNIIFGKHSSILGEENAIEGDNSYILGAFNDIEGNFTSIIGNSNDVYASEAISIGSANIHSENYTTTIGHSLTAEHEGAMLIGDYDTDESISSTEENQFTARFEGGYRFFIGTSNQLVSFYDDSINISKDINLTDEESIISRGEQKVDHLPYIKGIINLNGIVQEEGSTTNFSCTHENTGIYKITLASTSTITFTTEGTLVLATGRSRSSSEITNYPRHIVCVYEIIDEYNLYIHTMVTGGSSRDCDFSFMVFFN